MRSVKTYDDQINVDNIKSQNISLHMFDKYFSNVCPSGSMSI